MAKTFKKPTEGFDRPDHPDFMDTQELKKINFSGIRHNSLSEDIEIWVDGTIAKSITKFSRSMDERAVRKALEEVFGLEVVEIMDNAQQRSFDA